MTDSETTAKLVVEERDTAFRDEIASLPGGENIMRCFACGTCAAGCPVTNVDDEYNSRRIIRQILFGMREEVLGSAEIWLCQMCYRCSARCPQEVDFSDVMRVLRHLAVKEGYAPRERLSTGGEVDRLAQLIRRNAIKDPGEGGEKAVETLKAKVGDMSSPPPVA